MHDLIPKLANHHILVVGDVILDEYLTGTATRMSREAPIPVLEFESRRLIPGGAANPSVNIARLDSFAHHVGVVGDDKFGGQLRDVLAEHTIDTGGIITATGRTTTVKTRVMAHMGFRFPQQVARIDRVDRTPIDAATQRDVLAAVAGKRPAMAAILFSDYHVGLLAGDMVAQIVREAQTHQPDLILTADAQGELGKYAGLTLVKCNADDARAYLGCEIEGTDGFGRAARQLFAELNLSGGMVITRGADGATLATAEGEAHIAAPAVMDVYDTVGAGDTFIAVMTLALAADATYQQAVRLANYASGLVVRKVGNYAPSPDELARAVAMWERL
jgi:rfaE bifunctional protein kinase chain/domain